MTDIVSDVDEWKIAYIPISPIPAGNQMEHLLRDSVSCGRVPKSVIQEMTHCHKSVGASGSAQNNSEWVITTSEILEFLLQNEVPFEVQDLTIFEEEGVKCEAGKVHLYWNEHQYEIGKDNQNRTGSRRNGTKNRICVFDSTRKV